MADEAPKFRVVWCSPASVPGASEHNAEDTLMGPHHEWQAPWHKDGAAIELEFEGGALVVKNVDIANAGSAFVEVLAVLPSPAGKRPSLQVLLPIQMLMTVSDAKSGANRNKSRFFGPEKLTQGVSAQKEWQRIRVVCTNPFTQDKPLGLSYIRFNVGKSAQLEQRLEPPKITIPSARSLGKAQDQKHSPQPKPAPLPPPKIAPPPPPKPSPQPPPQPPPQPSPAKPKRTIKIPARPASLFFDYETTQPQHESTVHDAAASPAPKPADAEKKKNGTVDVGSWQKKKQKLEPIKPSETAATTATATATATVATSLAPVSDPARATPAKLKEKEKEKESEKGAAPPLGAPSLTGKEFDGIILAISGIQNPERGDLRAKVLKLGGKYVADCAEATHLVCEFTNTPKYREMIVKGGVVISKQWVHDSFSVGCRLDEGDYQVAEDGGTWGGGDDFAAADGGDDYDKDDENWAAPESHPYETRSKAPKEPSSPVLPDVVDELPMAADDTTKPMKKKTKKVGSVSTDAPARKRRRKKNASGESDSEFESSGPDEYDLHDSFIDNRHSEEIEREADRSDDDIEDTVREANRFLAQSKAQKAHPPPTKKLKIHVPAPVLPKEIKQKESSSDSEQHRRRPKTLRKSSSDLSVLVAGPAKEVPKKDDDGHVTEPLADETVQKQPQPQSQQQQPPKAAPQPPKPKVVGHAGPVKPLPDFLSGVRVYFYGDLEADLRARVTQYLYAYNAQVVDYLFEETTHVVTCAGWDPTFDEATEVIPKLLIVRPAWVFSCHIEQSRVPEERFLVRKGDEE
eukprot:TRINITY_DN5842_c0_g1_i2.p1 TRINITY_DN5842_c0_g1~~TRINITY_DN5842_c0_g1_i2.p1  ORF type:complete len:807 (-),score=188.76 TRINITY_DN5842_c0_g1_i2:1256-3655(-)